MKWTATGERERENGREKEIGKLKKKWKIRHI